MDPKEIELQPCASTAFLNLVPRALFNCSKAGEKRPGDEVVPFSHFFSLGSIGLRACYFWLSSSY